MRKLIKHYAGRYWNEHLRPLIRGDKLGATAIEYGLIAALLGIMIVLALDTLKTEVGSLLPGVKTQVEGPRNASGPAQDPPKTGTPAEGPKQP